MSHTTDNQVNAHLREVARRIEHACRSSMPSVEEQLNDRLWSDRELIYRQFTLLAVNGDIVGSIIQVKQDFIYKLLLELTGKIEIPLLRKSQIRENEEERHV